MMLVKSIKGVDSDGKPERSRKTLTEIMFSQFERP